MRTGLYQSGQSAGRDFIAENQEYGPGQVAALKPDGTKAVCGPDGRGNPDFAWVDLNPGKIRLEQTAGIGRPNLHFKSACLLDWVLYFPEIL